MQLQCSITMASAVMLLSHGLPGQAGGQIQPCLTRSRAFVSPSAFIAAVPTNSSTICPFSTSWLIHLYRMSICRVYAVWRGLNTASRTFWLSVWMSNGVPYGYPASVQICAIHLMLKVVDVRLMNSVSMVEIVTIVCFWLFQIIG